jgi:WD40 repeat protein
LNEYRGHKCVGYNIETNFFVNEKYVITGSEDSHIHIYDTVSSNLVYKYKTHQKCVNLVKPLPECWPYSFVFTGLEDISIYIWGVNKTISKLNEKATARKNNEKVEHESDYEKLINNIDRDPTQRDNMKLFEDIMTECGDMILRIFHSNNLTYSNGMNFENLIEILQRNNDQESLRLMNLVCIVIV